MDNKSCKSSFHDDTRGSVMVEFSILLPIYVTVVMALMYHFALTSAMLDGVRATLFAAGTPGVQDVSDLPSRYFRESGGTVIPGTTNELFLDEFQEPEFYTEDLINDNLLEVAMDPVGYYVYQNGSFEYVLDEDQMSPYGEYIFSNNLQDLSDEVAEMMAGTMEQATATTQLTFHMPVMEDPLVIEKSQTAIIPLNKDRGTHEGEGNSDFNHQAVLELFGEDISNGHADKNIEFWAPN